MTTTADKKPLVIGLTGPSGAGKGVVASLFARYGVPSLDTDAIYHHLLLPPSPCLDQLVERFGADILTEDGYLDRGALAARVFAPGHEDDLAALNRIAHQHILAEVRTRLAEYAKNGTAAVLVDAPQLFESGFDTECDRILAVLAPASVRLSRLMARDGLNEARAMARMAAQHDDAFFRERAHAVLCNTGSPEDLDPSVRQLLTQWEVPYEI